MKPHLYLTIIPLLAIALSASAHDYIDISAVELVNDLFAIRNLRPEPSTNTESEDKLLLSLAEGNDFLFRDNERADEILQRQFSINKQLMQSMDALESSNEVLRAQLAECQTNIPILHTSWTNDGPTRVICFVSEIQTNTITVTNWVTVTVTNLPTTSRHFEYNFYYNDCGWSFLDPNSICVLTSIQWDTVTNLIHVPNTTSNHVLYYRELHGTETSRTHKH